MGRFKDLASKPQMVAIQFNLIDEANKAIKVITEVPSKYPMRADRQDLNAMGFKDNDMGFFFMLIESTSPDTQAFEVVRGEERAAIELLRKLNVQHLRGNMWIASTGCTWDVAKERFNETSVFGYRAVVFSTPDQLMILAENP